MKGKLICQKTQQTFSDFIRDKFTPAMKSVNIDFYGGNLC